MQQFYRLISTNQPISIPLHNSTLSPQSQSVTYKQPITQNTQDKLPNSQQVNENNKQSQSHKDIGLINSINNQYVSQVILISQSVICTVTKSNLDFYSIKHNKSTKQQPSKQDNNNQNNRFIGRLSANTQIREQLKLNHQVNSTSQQQHSANKQTSKQKLSIIQQKGIIYHTDTNTFYLLLQSATNKYFVSFTLNIIDVNTQSSQQQFANQKGLTTNNKNPIQINEFSIIYDFNHSSSQVKYSLQLNPQILLFYKSSTPILIRKFYNDSFVVIFQRNNNNLNKKYSNYWSFYINEQCLSLLDEQNFLVNYRQLITKNHAQIDIIDINNKHKTFIRINQGIQPMTIKSIQLYLPQHKIKNIKKTQDKQDNQDKHIQSRQKHEKKGWRLRIFSILKRTQSSYILDYDIIHQTVVKSYRLDDVFFDSVSFSNTQRQFYFVNYLYRNRNWLGVLKSDQNEYIDNNNNNQESSFKLVNKLIDSSVQFELNSFAWSINKGLVIQSSILVRNNVLKIKCSKIVNKSLHYAKIIHQLKNQYQILGNQQLSCGVYQMLNGNRNNDG